jgi:hypothetical protein
MKKKSPWPCSKRMCTEGGKRVFMPRVGNSPWPLLILLVAATVQPGPSPAESVEVPGTHQVEIGCQYSRSPGVFTLTAYGSTSASGNLSVTLGNPTPISLEDGTYEGRFSYDEPRSEGRVLSYHGEAEAMIAVQEGSGSIRVVQETARGAEGVPSSSSTVDARRSGADRICGSVAGLFCPFCFHGASRPRDAEAMA